MISSLRTLSCFTRPLAIRVTVGGAAAALLHDIMFVQLPVVKLVECVGIIEDLRT